MILSFIYGLGDFMISMLICEFKDFQKLWLIYFKRCFGTRLNYKFETFEKLYKKFREKKLF